MAVKINVYELSDLTKGWRFLPTRAVILSVGILCTLYKIRYSKKKIKQCNYLFALQSKPDVPAYNLLSGHRPIYGSILGRVLATRAEIVTANLGIQHFLAQKHFPIFQRIEDSSVTNLYILEAITYVPTSRSQTQREVDYNTTSITLLTFIL